MRTMAEPATTADASDRRRVGRPARISREMIAEAANELGLEGLRLKAVADHLGVSIAALYHHVAGKDDLMRLAAEFSARKVPLPQDRGQHWAVWLLEWARYNRDAFTTEPALLAQYLEGAISAESMADNLDLILGVLVRQGFTAIEASAAYEMVSSCAIGTAVGILRERNALENGRSTVAAQRQILRKRPAADLTHLRGLWAEAETVEKTQRNRPSPFQDRITTLVMGIAVRKGEDPGVVAERIQSSPLPRRGRRRR